MGYGIRAGERIAAQDKRGGALQADPLREPPHVPAAGVDPHVEEPRIEAGALAGDDDVAGERQVHSSMLRRTVLGMSSPVGMSGMNGHQDRQLR
jgi:hypothetical protein